MRFEPIRVGRTVDAQPSLLPGNTRARPPKALAFALSTHIGPPIGGVVTTRFELALVNIGTTPCTAQQEKSKERTEPHRSHGDILGIPTGLSGGGGGGLPGAEADALPGEVEGLLEKAPGLRCPLFRLRRGLGEGDDIAPTLDGLGETTGAVVSPNEEGGDPALQYILWAPRPEGPVPVAYEVKARGGAFPPHAEDSPLPSPRLTLEGVQPDRSQPADRHPLKALGKGEPGGQVEGLHALRIQEHPARNL